MQNHGNLFRIFLTTILVLALSACATERTAPPSGLHLYVFNCGTIDVLDLSVFQPGIGKGDHKKLTDSCYLVVHPKGTLMWDAGLPDALAQTPEGKTMMDTFVIKMPKTLASQLKEIGYAPESIKNLGISHMHFDHVGNADLFPHATLLMQKEEYDAAFGPEPAKYGFDPATYSTMHSNPVKTLEGDYDVFGDGAVVIKRMLGHTPGHQALYVKLPKTGNILLSGDLVHYTDNWVNKRVPSFNFDKEQSIKTMEETEQFLKANHAVLWIQHDLEQNAGIKHAPAYYD
ncbi:metallo-beta-lactamase superfamily protein [Sulfurirhabdus autotrophica]|uniref:Metallo-beta-lactamase superfamily protein n=2 Tax=Sulfurirhabdus autotrophica TaxID=1706046 RepID=A0A4R3Y169_9PROT|nr:metallo-beta-lactamase superfamily protein [Sulfurirhabdus autotrophica]